MSNLNNNINTDLNTSIGSSSLLNLLNISQQFSSPNSLLHQTQSTFARNSHSFIQSPTNDLLGNSHHYNSKHTNQTQPPPSYSFFSQFCSTLNDDTDRNASKSIHNSSQFKYSDSDKISIYQ